MIKPKKYTLVNKRRFIIFIFITCMIGITSISMFFGFNALGTQKPILKEVIISSGDTLWSIAEEYGICQDPRLFIDEIRNINQLESVALYPGDVIQVPIKP